MEPKRFHISDLLSITTGRLVSTRYMDGVYDILGWMTGQSLFAHERAEAADACRAGLLRQFPDLGKVVVPEGFVQGRARSQAGLLAEAIRLVGREWFEVAPIAGYPRRDPIQDLYDMASGRGEG